MPVVRPDTVEMSAWGVAALAGIQVYYHAPDADVDAYTSADVGLPVHQHSLDADSIAAHCRTNVPQHLQLDSQRFDLFQFVMKVSRS